MADIPSVLRRIVVARAGNRCEYCRLSQLGQEAAFHIDHVIPRAGGGATSEGNLALACVSCSLRKSDRTRIPDPIGGTLVAIFNPRVDSWQDHFRWKEDVLEATSAVGRATIDALALNRPVIRDIRREEMDRRRHP